MQVAFLPRDLAPIKARLRLRRDFFTQGHIFLGATLELLIYAGAGVAFLGLVGLGWCIWLALQAKRSGVSDAELKTQLQRVVALNMGALGLSALGLMMVVIGVLL